MRNTTDISNDSAPLALAALGTGPGGLGKESPDDSKRWEGVPDRVGGSGDGQAVRQTTSQNVVGASGVDDTEIVRPNPVEDFVPKRWRTSVRFRDAPPSILRVKASLDLLGGLRERPGSSRV